IESSPPLNAARPRQPNRGRSLRQSGFAPDQGVEAAMPLFHLGGRGVVCTHHRASNSEVLATATPFARPCARALRLCEYRQSARRVRFAARFFGPPSPSKLLQCFKVIW